ncbi:hypothetical protein ABIA32_000388 [Streptacidiphilus sp. MAP12-20]|uniref:hypothetical protein n=1 Tax=Streptacidiphilus sp. MAP12-20 TaxID=3156299 RepID=UPI0035177303
MPRARLVSVPVVLALAVAMTTTARADSSTAGTLYVNHDASCSDTAAAAGSASLPYCTLQAAVNAAQPGQTVKLTGPTGESFYGPLVLTHSGAPGAPITIDGSGDYLYPVSKGAPLTLRDVHDITVENLQLQASSGADLVDVVGSQDIVLDRLQSVDLASPAVVNGVNIDGGSSSVTVSRTQIQGMLSGSDVLVQAGAQHVTVTTNYLRDYSSAPGALIHVSGASGVAVTGNSLNSPLKAPAIAVDGAVSATTVENNVGFASQAPALSVSAAAAPQVSDGYNTFKEYEAGTDAYSWGGTDYSTSAGLATATGQGAHDIVMAPGTGFPAGTGVVDAADSSAPGELSTDLYGHSRVPDPSFPHLGAGPYNFYDRGAWEVEDTIGYSAPTSPQVTTVGTSVDGQAVPVPTSAWHEQLTATVDFGDGSALQSAPVGAALPHAYTQPGTYLTTTVITNTGGYSVSYSRDVQVLSDTVEQPVLSAKPLRTGGYSPGTMDFSISVTPGEIYRSLTLDHGDGVVGDWGMWQDATYAYPHSGVYPVKLTAVDVLGRTETAEATAVAGADFVPLSGGPQRVYDSRTAGHIAIPAHGTLRLALAHPQDGNEALVLNLTATDTRAAGFVTAYPDGTSAPTASNLNFSAGQTIANQATVRTGANGYVDFSNGSSGPIDLVVDEIGSQSMTVDGTEYQPAAPTRILDTRTSAHQVPGHGTVTVQLPASLRPAGGGPDTLEVNVTAAREHGPGFATVYTTGGSRPVSSNLNWSVGTPAANLATVTADSQGRVTLYNGSAGPADFVVDFLGLYQPTSATGPTTGFVTAAPTRALDTRYGIGAPAGQLAPHQQLQLCLPVRAGASAAALNLTVTGSSQAGWLSTYPAGTARPGTSSINWGPGETIANMTQTPVGAGGCVDLYNGGGAAVSVIADLSGYQYTQP